MSHELILELIKTINSFRDEFNQKLDIMQQEIVEMKQDISELKKDVAELKKDVAELKQETASLRKDVTILQQEVADIKQDLIDFHQEFNNVAKKVERNEDGTFETFEKYGDFIDKRFNENKERIDNIEKNCTKCQNRTA